MRREIVMKVNAEPVKALPRARVEALRDAMLGLETLPDAGQIAALMAPG